MFINFFGPPVKLQYQIFMFSYGLWIRSGKRFVKKKKYCLKIQEEETLISKPANAIKTYMEYI